MRRSEAMVQLIIYIYTHTHGILSRALFYFIIMIFFFFLFSNNKNLFNYMADNIFFCLDLYKYYYYLLFVSN